MSCVALMTSSLFASYPGSPPEPRGVSNILLPLDGSEASRGAMPLVRHLVELYKATPHLIYAGEQAIEPGQRIEQLGLGWRELPGAVVDQSSGSAPEIILALAQKLAHCVIVMCTHTGKKREPDRFGSVTEAVLSGNPERIILVPSEGNHERFPIRTLVLCHDGTPSATVATNPAAELAHLCGAEVIAVLVAPPCTECPEELGSLPAPQYLDQPQHEWPSWAHEFSMRMLALGSAPASLKFELVVSGGQPGSEIAHLARTRNADMVVMAVSSDWKSRRHNVVRIVTNSSGCPVFLVRSVDYE
jgi:nucleotide-binding universal stress UspA family protein